MHTPIYSVNYLTLFNLLGSPFAGVDRLAWEQLGQGGERGGRRGHEARLSGTVGALPAARENGHHRLMEVDRRQGK
jgi:hypothetical protein